jgi:hypothetical protein
MRKMGPTIKKRTKRMVTCQNKGCGEQFEESMRGGHAKRYCSSGCKWQDWDRNNPRRKVE